MPVAVASRKPVGMASAICSRNGVAETIRNSTPAQDTIPSATGHGTRCCNTIVNAKNALRPMPGATANGSLAYSPINSVIAHASTTVAVSTPEKAMPVPCDARIPGLTTTMYAIVKNVVMPPTMSPDKVAGQLGCWVARGHVGWVAGWPGCWVAGLSGSSVTG